MHEPARNRPSVIDWVPGKGERRSLLLNAHLDTVGVDGMSDPFNSRIENGRMYGRGAYDIKAGLAACMLALADIRPGELASDVLGAAGIPTLPFGPHGAGVHAVDEWVDLQSVDQCRETLSSNHPFLRGPINGPGESTGNP